MSDFTGWERIQNFLQSNPTCTPMDLLISFAGVVHADRGSHKLKVAKLFR
jgi:hypothetical protein